MIMSVAMIGPKFYAWDRNGKPLAFGKLYTYQARTNIPKSTYKSEDQITENTNPVILNGEGYADIYLDGSYKMVLKDKDDNEIWSSDPVTAQMASEWINCRTANYNKVDTFTIPGDSTAEYDLGRSVRMSDGVGFSYGTITSSYYASGSTFVVIDSTVPVGIIGCCASIIGINSTGFIDQIEDNTRAITKNQQDIAANAAGIANNASNINAVETKNTEQDSVIESNSNRISTNESDIATLQTGQGSGVYGYETKALLDADLTPPDQSIAYVTNDATSTNNGTYRKDGATGVGSWVQASTDLASQAYQIATDNESVLDGRFYDKGKTNGWYSPFFRLAVQDDANFLDRSRFDQVTNYTVLPSQLFDGQRLQFETAVSLPKCKVYADEMGTTDGDTITIRALVTGSGDVRIYARNYGSTGSAVGGEQNAGLFTVVPGGTVLTLEATLDPNTFETRIYIDGAQAIYSLESLWVTEGTQAFSPLTPTLDNDEALKRDVESNTDSVNNSLLPRVDYAIEDYEEVTGDTESINLAVTNPQVETPYGTEFTGWGERLSPAGVTFNALRARFIGRNTSTIVDSGKWRNIKCVVRTANTDPHLATSTIVAVGSIQVLEATDVLENVTILLRDPVSGLLKTITDADLDAEYFIGFYYTNKDNGKAFGSGARADLPNSLGDSYYTTKQDTAVLTSNWSNDSADRGIGFDHILITNPVESTVFAPTPEFKEDILGGSGGQVGVAYYGENNLKNYLAKWSKMIANTDQMVVGLFGDSWVNTPHRIYKPIRDWFDLEYGINSDGYVSANFDITNPDGSISRGRSGTWTQIRTNSAAIGPDTAQTSTTDINATLTLTSVTATTYVVHYLQQSGGGSFDISVDGGPVTSVDTNGTDQYQTATISGTGQLLIDITGIASLGVTIAGIECRNDTNGEILFHKLGSGGARASTFANQNSIYAVDAYSALRLDVAMILVGTNDNYSDVVPSVFKSELETIIARLKSANPLIDIVLVGAGDNGSSHAYTIQEYNAEMYALATENDYATISLYEFLGPYADANGRGLYSDIDHPNADGGQVIGRSIINRLLKV